MVWLGIQIVALKPINALGQVMLAWFIAPEVLGLVAMAFTVTTFVDLIQQAGVNQVLIHRHTSYRLWSSPAFWMTMAMGFLASVIIVVSARLVAQIYSEPQLVGLLLLTAIAPPIRALALVPRAKLQIDMRFGMLAKTMVITQAMQTAFTVALAAFGFGAYSVILPIPLIEAIRAGIYWWFAQTPIRMNLQLRKWRYLVSDTFYTLVAEICFRVIQQGDYITLAAL